MEAEYSRWDEDGNKVNILSEKIKEEVDITDGAPEGASAQNDLEINNVQQYHFMNNPNSWDSGIVLDSTTVVQMAEFQEVVDNLQRQVPPPPPYPTNLRPTVVVTPSNTTIDQELEQILRSNPVIYDEPKQFPQTYQGGAPKFDNMTKAGCQSLPTNVHKHPNVIDKVEPKYISNQR